MNHKIILILSAFLLITNAEITYSEDAVTSVVREGVHGAFDEFERQIIKKYFADSPVEKQTNKNKKHKDKKGKSKQLPPGIAKKLERGGTLPPGIAKRDLPNDLKKKLPAAPEGYEHVIVGNDVMSVDIDTGKIADIITDVLLGN